MRKQIPNTIKTIVLFIILVVQIYPVIWIFSSSLKTKVQFREQSPFSLPSELYFKNYLDVMTNSNILRYFTNSLVVTAVSVFFILMLSCLAGFALRKFRFKSNKILLLVFLSGIMIPIQVTLIPLFQIYNKLDILNSYLSVVLPQIGFGLPTSIYLFAAFFEYLPNDILEASVIDGCNVYSSFTRIAVPVSMNSGVTVVIINAIYIWNEFIFANTFLSKDTLKTLPLGLMDFIGERGQTDWGMTFAAISISIIPLVLIYFTLNKRIVAGMAAGAVKT